MSEERPSEERPPDAESQDTEEPKPKAPRVLSFERGEWFFIAIATFAVGLWGLWDGFIEPDPEKSVRFNQVLSVVMFAAFIFSFFVIRHLKQAAPAESPAEAPAEETPPESEAPASEDDNP